MAPLDVEDFREPRVVLEQSRQARYGVMGTVCRGVLKVEATCTSVTRI